MTVQTVPKSYTDMLLFLLNGSGIWAMIAVTFVSAGYKTITETWSWWDSAIIGAFFMLRGVVEWAIHSWLYHANPLPFLGWRLKSGASLQHLQHHKDPEDISRLLITYKGVLVLACLVFLTSLLIFRNLNIAFTMVLGLMVIGVMIEVVHLICHCHIPHRTSVMRKIVWLHRFHHTEDHNNYYGVSSSLGDRLFSTYPDKP